MPADRPILEFKTQAEWRTWLKKHHAIHTGIRLRFYKKGSGIPTVYYPEALDEALCHGWIDGQARSLDEASYLQRFTPRRPKGLWSKINIGHIERLTREGKMMPRGIQEVEAAQKDGRWDAAYAGQRDAKVPEDFEATREGQEGFRVFQYAEPAESFRGLLSPHHGEKTRDTRTSHDRDS